MAAPLNPLSTQPHCWCPGGDPGSGGVVWRATAQHRPRGDPCSGDRVSKDSVTYWGLRGACGRRHFAAVPERSSTFLFVACCWQQDTRYPSGKWMASWLACCCSKLLQVPACHLPPFPPSSLSLSASWVLSCCALQESCEAPCATQAPMFLQPQHSRCSKREQGVWWSTVFCNGGVLEGTLSEDADSLAGACCKPPPAQACVLKAASCEPCCPAWSSCLRWVWMAGLLPLHKGQNVLQQLSPT